MGFWAVSSASMLAKVGLMCSCGKKGKHMSRRINFCTWALVLYATTSPRAWTFRHSACVQWKWQPFLSASGNMSRNAFQVAFYVYIYIYIYIYIYNFSQFTKQSKFSHSIITPIKLSFWYQFFLGLRLVWKVVLYIIAIELSTKSAL